MLFKTKYSLHSEDLLKKRKNKTAEYVALTQMKGVYCVSILIGNEEFFKFITEVAEVFFKCEKSE